MAKIISLLSRFKTIILMGVLIALLFAGVPESWAKRPPEIRNQDDLNITQDMHGQDLSGYEFVKFDLRGINFRDSNLTGAVFNNSKLNGADLHGANLKDALAYASDFEDADLTDSNLSNALLMESSFNNAIIEGADFTDAVLSRIQQKQLCSIADGTNSSTGISTSYSLGC
ncbi:MULTISPECIES: pentapeptide repeat-containing protein [Prochlorococcus]|uniref:Secreted pentapeptide repeats protein n=1 Tax=Prochlorococcus marinus (strain SARG / CCMP1375 / SS120) TaxID=167539 RepID=Q7VC92_PROMA|nr:MULTISPECIES: pentapeptide repeat-containing protein [Prochlorococcus]AAP99894.1 Secreted pentapeptide repeats protein [Prochlorococcus marinus subsp. marinus str. CCMP1375]KGG11759.1 putative lumenal protein [Prochlorococcus marinus str. LG]KGG18827.1 putative lumenal protein [Prochlorococcus marinus str. SS2]KGG23635.1 putative lumenal protein [Prochlorococcus marinus str. SS35]KGG32129.1 putative lumenal protein [Prochlorococcus marinus str. SS51]